MITRAEEKRAAKQDREVSQVVRSSAPANSRLARFIRQASILAVTNRFNSVVLVDSTSVESIFLDASTLSFVTGIKSEKSRKTIALSIKSKASAISKEFDVDLGDVRRNLRTTTGRALRRAIAPLEKRLNSAISDINSKGMSKAKAKVAMSKALTRMGISTANSSYIDTLMRTHMQFSYSAARWQTTIDDPDVKSYKYVTMEDNLVRPAHDALNGLTRLKDDPIWLEIWTPNGWNCRCQILAIYEKVRQTRIPRNIKIDDGFEFNSGIELNVA